MSKNPNAGQSKIPKFGSRISHPATITSRTNTQLQPQRPPHTQLQPQRPPHTQVRPPRPPQTRVRAPRPPQTQQQASEPPRLSCITNQHLGRFVRTGDKRGILRFLGPVEFAKGTWCGIELQTASGKNDGSINSVRYFDCAAGCGLMAPLSNVTLIEDTARSRENLSDDTSGPHSMLFIDPQVVANNTLLLNDNERRTISNVTRMEQTGVFTIANNKLPLNNTFSLQNKNNQTQELPERTDNPQENSPCNESNAQQLNETYNRNQQEDGNNADTFVLPTQNQEIERLLSRNLNETIEKPSSLPQLKSNSLSNTIVLQPLILKKLNYSTPLKPDTNDPFLRNLRLSSIYPSDNASTNDDDSKRDSLEYDESLGILTPGQIEENPSLFDGLLDDPKPDNLDSTLVNHSDQPTCYRLGWIDEELVHESNMNFHNWNKSNDLKVTAALLDETNCDCIITKMPKSADELNLTIATTKHSSHAESQSTNINNNISFNSGLLKVDASRNCNSSFERSTNPTALNYTGSVPNSIFDKTTETKPSNVNSHLPMQAKEELQSPNLNSATEYSFGIINDQILSNLTLITDTTINLDLPLDSIDKSKDFTITRLEQTPSPEELPLDPTPIVEMDPKTEPTKSKTSSCFITSITSITSLDTGYQGDGEMSRPASRGADNSPLTRRPLPRPQARRQDPMTDSDFYTESDADNHEDNPLRGDRKAQVIDGTLYGVDPQAAADIYVNNRENMDSSGIFTDLENNISSRNEDDVGNLQVPDPSPSDTSTKTISENSQNNLQDVLDKTNEKSDSTKQIIKDNPKKRNAPSPGIMSPSSFSSPRHSPKDGSSAKKYKMPRRDVPSKLKTMLEPTVAQVIDHKVLKKPAGRWDEVMSKISKNEHNKSNLKEVKSKVFNNIHVNNGTSQRHVEDRKINQRFIGNQKPQNYKIQPPSATGKENVISPKIINFKVRTEEQSKNTPLKRPRSAQSNTSSEKRRVRNRPNSGSTSKINITVESSIHSSLSDLSAATLPPNKKTIGSSKKRNDVVQVTQVLTANKLSPRIQQQTAIENKKNATPPKTRRNLFSPKTEKQTAAKECGRGTIKGGRTSPTVLPGKQQPQAPPTRVAAVVGNSQEHRTAEGLAILIQHLVFNVGAFEVPTLRRQVETYRRKAEEIQLAFQCLEKSLAEQKICYQQSIEDERFRHQNEIANLTEKHRNEVEKLGSEHAKLEQCLLAEKENSRQNLCKQHEEQLSNLKNEFIKLQRTHEESLQILREENDDIREQIDEKRSELEKVRHESQKLKEDYENKEAVLNTHIQRHRQQINNLQNQYEEKFAKLIEESSRLREENDRLLGYGDDKGISLQEVQSLRVVLELKQNEVTELRKALEKAIQKAELLEGAEEKARVLNAKCEDLQLQLERKSDFEKSLVSENQKLQESFREETNQNRRLSRHCEELRWKLEQNKEVVAKVFEQAEEGIFNRTLLSSSFNERHLTKSNLDRTLSFKDRMPNRSSYSVEDSGKSKNIEDMSPPTSPIVKGVVEKSDSVSYVLDLDESPEVIASRIVRRSFRNTTPPKNTPTKSPSNKRPRIRIGLSQSASSSAIISPRKNEVERSHSSNRNNDSESDDAMTNLPKYEGNSDSCESSNFSMKLDDNLDLDEDEIDIALPALPSELNKTNGVQALPTPKHLAGDNMISDSNSEDESTSSSHL